MTHHASSAPPSARLAPLPVAELFVGGLAALAASTPARNPDLWRHLAAGRAVLSGAFADLSPTWLFDVLHFLLWSAGGGVAVVGAKVVAVAAAAVLMLRASRAGGAGGWIAAASTALAVLTLAVRLPVQPGTYAVLFLAVVVWLLHRPTAKLWPLAVVFLIWANADRWFLTGLGVVALTWVGRALDGRPVRRWPLKLLALAGVCLLNPAHLSDFPKPPEGTAPTWVFGSEYRAAVDHPAAVAYYPLLGLGLISFLVNHRSWRWDRFLPWAGLAGLSVIQPRAIPLFAALAGPVLAWNMAEAVARSRGLSWRRWTAVKVAGGVLALGLLAAAWAGWHGRPPFGARRWAVELPAVGPTADAVRKLTASGAWPNDSRTLHLSADTAAGFAWAAPDDPGNFDPKRINELFAGDGVPDPGRLRAAGFTRVVAFNDPRVDRLLDDPQRWPLLHLDGGWFVFGVGSDSRLSPVDLDTLGLTADDPAPPAGPRPAPWWHVFTTPVPVRTADRDQAAALVRVSDAVRRRAPFRHLAEWEAAQTAALVGAAADPHWAGFAGWRLALVRPPLPDEFSPVSGLVFGVQQRFVRDRDDTPPGPLYAAVRAARRAVAADPTDSAAYLTLGRAYARLIDATRERGWADRREELSSLRQVQAIAAVRRAVDLAPKSAEARLALGVLYQSAGVLDSAVEQFRAYRALVPVNGAVSDADFDKLVRKVDAAREAWAKDAARARVSDRAMAAVDRGLGGTALNLLLESDVAAFGPAGTKIELELLLQNGRPLDVIEWANPEVGQSLGAAAYHRLRVRAHAAAGDYAAADAALAELADTAGPAGGPGRFAELVGGLVGREVLAEAAVGPPTLPGGLLRAIGRSDFLVGLDRLVGGRAVRAEVFTLRGWLAVEAGDLTAARRWFTEASPDPLAAEWLRMLDGAR